MGIGNRIKRLRKAAGLGLEKASWKLEVGMSHLQRLEAGSDPRASTLRRLAEGYARLLNQDPREVLVYLVFGEEVRDE